MDDVFLGAAPPRVGSLISLPRVPRTVRLAFTEDRGGTAFPVRTQSRREVTPVPQLSPQDGTREAPTDVPQQGPAGDPPGSVIELSSVARIPEPLDPATVQDEFRTFLREEDAREQQLSFRAEAYRRERRATLRASLTLHPAMPSGNSHLRARKSVRSSAAPRPTKPPALRYRPPRSPRVRATGIALQDIRTPDADQARATARAVPRSEERPAVTAPKSPGWTRTDLFHAQDTSEGDQRLLVAPPIPWRKVRKVKLSQPARARPLRYRVREAVVVFFITTIMGGAIGLLGVFGRLPRITALVGGTARDGAVQLLAGLKAITVADVTAGQEALNRASTLFQRAETELQSSTSTVTRLLAYLDPRDRYASGRALLDAGQKLSTLGEDAARLVLLFKDEGGEAASLTDTLNRAQPLLVRLSTGLTEVETMLQGVSVEGMPPDVRSELQKLQQGSRGLAQLMSGLVGSYDVLLELLGARHDRQYLVVFQNNRELRPTGGFIGSLALVDVSRGEVRKVAVDTIYNPDGQLKEYIVPPAPLRKITDRWFARDANWFADFRRSAQKVATLFERSGGPTVDGVIAVTPTVLEQLLRITGPIAMPQYGLTVNAENVLDETQRLVTIDYDREKNTPKAFIADLMPEILSRVAALPRDRWGTLADLFMESLQNKHVLVFLRDVTAQAAVETLGWAGAVEEARGDYLLRVEANVGGHKTDELMDQSVSYDVTIAADGTAVATLVTTRHHQGSLAGRPGWNVGEDWYRKTNIVYERVLVPRGSELLEARGFTREGEVPTVYENTADYRTYETDPDLSALEDSSRTHNSGTIIAEEEGKTSFGNWVVTAPGETSVTVYRYRLPFRYDVRSAVATAFNYSLLLQSQPGHRPVRTQATLRLPPGYQVSWVGPEGSVTRDGERKAVFTEILTHDRVWGVVAEQK